MMLSLNQAAKECGRAKSTLLEAIKKGRLTAPKNKKGHYEIDPSELFRVFERNTRAEQTEPASSGSDRVPSALLEAKIDAQGTLLARMEAEIEDLRSQRDKWQAQAERQTLLLENADRLQSGGLWSLFRSKR